LLRRGSGITVIETMVRQLQRAELANCTSCACFNLRKVTRAVTQLYQGLIEVAAGADRRSRIVTITAEGNAAIAEALPFWKKAQPHVVNSLGQERWADMLTGLGELVALMNAK
jgi:hypothetical protein